MFGGLGVQELLIVFIIALVLFGGKQLPEVGKNLGKALRSFKKAEEETRRNLEDAVKEPPVTKEDQDGAGKEGGEKENGEPGKKVGDESAAGEKET